MKLDWMVPLVGMLVVSSSSHAQVINGNFESGLTGWTPAYLYGTWYSPYYAPHSDPVPAPISDTELAELALSYGGQYQYNAYTPTDSTGGHFLSITAIECRGAGGPRGVPYTDSGGTTYEWVPGNPSRITLSQGVFLRAGEKLTGSAQFYNTDMPDFTNDCTWVQVTGPGVDQRVWFMNYPTAAALYEWPNDGNEHITPWVEWSWCAPADGTYTLTLNELNDDQLQGYGHYDDIMIVPEPSAIALAGVAAIIISRRRGWGLRSCARYPDLPEE